MPVVGSHEKAWRAGLYDTLTVVCLYYSIKSLVFRCSLYLPAIHAVHLLLSSPTIARHDQDYALDVTMATSISLSTWGPSLIGPKQPCNSFGKGLSFRYLPITG